MGGQKPTKSGFRTTLLRPSVAFRSGTWDLDLPVSACLPRGCHPLPVTTNFSGVTMIPPKSAEPTKTTSETLGIYLMIKYSILLGLSRLIEYTVRKGSPGGGTKNSADRKS